MSNIDRANQSDSPSLSVGEFRSGTGRARQTPGNLHTSKKAKESDLSNSHHMLNDRVSLY